MTEQDLQNQLAKLKGAYAQTINGQQAAATTDMNTQLNTQLGQDTTDRANADINANNNAKQLRDLAARNGFSGGGEMLTGVLKTNQDENNQIGGINKSETAFKSNWNNKLNAMKSGYQNDINNYNTQQDISYQDKIDTLRAQNAAAAAQRAAAAASASRAKAASTASAKAATLTANDKAQMLAAYNEGVSGANSNLPATGDWLKANQAALMKAGLWDSLSVDFAHKYQWIGTPTNLAQQQLADYYANPPTTTKDLPQYNNMGGGSRQMMGTNGQWI